MRTIGHEDLKVALGLEHGDLLEVAERPVPDPKAGQRQGQATAVSFAHCWPHAIAGRTGKAFAQAICQLMANDSPEQYLLNMSKQKRAGKIFLDYLRNDRLSTAVAPLSPRARDGATVSMPLTWAQVKGDLDPKRYTIRSVPALLAKSKAWQGYDDAASSIKAAMKKLAEKAR